MGDNSTELYSLLKSWLEVADKEREAVEARSPAASFQEFVAAKEELKGKIAQILPGLTGGVDPACALLLQRIVAVEKENRDLLAAWLGELREELSSLQQGREAVQAYLGRKAVPEARFLDKKR